MNKAKAHMWIDEMESGRWRKARETFARGDRDRCAVGVLYEISGKNSWPFSANWLQCSEEFLDEVACINDKTPGWDKVIERILKEADEQ